MNRDAVLEVHPIETPDGKTLRTLADARNHVLAMPETGTTRAAAGELLKAAEHGGPFLMIARIVVAKAIYGDSAPPIGEASRIKKRDQWGRKRKEAGN